MTIETGGTFFERQCSITTPVQIEILPGKPFYLYIANLAAKSVSLPTSCLSNPKTNAIRFEQHECSNEHGDTHRANKQFDQTSMTNCRRIEVYLKNILLIAIECLTLSQRWRALRPTPGFIKAIQHRIDLENRHTDQLPQPRTF